jgi:CHAT domain-containing protein/Tfp pilus assembly protein PilF
MKKKHFYITIISLLFFCKNIAQNSIDSTSIYFNQKKYNKALSYGTITGNFPLLNTMGVNLYKNKDYQNSLLFFTRTLEIGQETLDENTLYILLKIIGQNYVDLKNYDNAESYYNSAYLLNSKMHGELHESNIKNLLSLIIVFDSKKEYGKSTECYIKIAKIRKNLTGENDQNYTRTLYNTGWAYVDQKLYDEAEKYFIKALEIDSKIIDVTSIDFSISLNNLFVFYKSHKIDYEKAEYYLRQIIKIKINKFGRDGTDYLDSYEMLGFLYESQNKYSSALNIFNEVLQKREIYKNKLYIVTLNSIVRINCKINNSNDANYLERICKKYLIDTENILGKKDQFYLLGLSYLASFYRNNDLFYLAEKKYEEIIDIKKNILNEDSNTLFPTYESLANVYVDEGNYNLAEKLLQFVLNKKIENNSSKDEIAITYNNLAIAYMAGFKYDLALSNYLKAIEIIEKEYTEERNDYGTYLNNLGLLYLKLNKHKEAEFYLVKSLKINKKVRGEFGNSYLLACNNLAWLYQEMNKCNEAEKYSLISINNCQNKNSKDYKGRFLNLATIYDCLNDKPKEIKYLIKASNFFMNSISVVNYNYTSTQQELMLHNIISSRNFPLSFLIRNPNQNEIIEVAFNEELLLKNMSIHNQKRVENSIKKSDDNELKIRYEEFTNNKKKITTIRESTNENQQKEYEELIFKTDKLEKYIIEKSNDFNQANRLISSKKENIQSKIKANEIIIDIVDFKYFESNKQSGKKFYSAFIVSRDYKKIKFINLFEEKQLTFLLERNVSQHDSSRIDKQYLDRAISDLFLKPLEKELENVTTIYLSLSGLGHQIDFAALPINEYQTLGSKYKLHILSSPSEIMDYNIVKLEKGSISELLLYGGIDYDKTNALVKTSTDIVDNNDIFSELKTRSGISEFGYLAGSKKEVSLIQLKCAQNGFKTTLFEDRAATEESIKALDGRTTPFILHLATHGFFFSNPEEQTPKYFNLEMEKSKIYKASSDAMLRSGLVFAGANKSWSKAVQNHHIDDGILTASEISNLDLSACQLAVLSACETGLGEVKGSEGVFGLQRAFRMAGVKNIIMSLWKVPDIQTAELFDIFYGECFAGKSIHEAFQSAQAKMKAKYSPYYWAGFVLLE